MQPQTQRLLEKLERLSPARLAEVEDFVLFLDHRDQDQRLRQDYSQASEASFSKVWDNDEDAIYDSL